MTGDVANILKRFRRPLDGAFARLGGKDLGAFLDFCRAKRLHEATGPGAASPLSIRAAGECYLAATRPGYRRMTRVMFDEALVRLADAAYPSNITLPDKLRALLVQQLPADRKEATQHSLRKCSRHVAIAAFTTTTSLFDANGQCLREGLLITLDHLVNRGFRIRVERSLKQIRRDVCGFPRVRDEQSGQHSAQKRPSFA